MKKSKEATIPNLYNFNAEDEENRKVKNKKSSKKNNKKRKSKSETTKAASNGKKNNKIDLNNEIVIGLPKIKNKEVNKQANKNSKTKNTKKNKSNKKKIIAKKPINKKTQEIKRKKIERNLKIAKYVFLSLCVLAIIVFTMTSPLFNIKQIIVEGNEKITKDEIISLSQINTGENTYKANINRSKKNILENPYIKDVTIKRKLPDKVIITVEERKATYMIEYGGGYVYINNQGYILEVSSEKLQVPIIQGAETNAEDFVPGNRMCKEDLEKMSTVIKIMELATNNEIASLISRIDIENSQNYKIVFESEQKVAYLGEGTDLITKVLHIKEILERTKDETGEIFVNLDLKNNDPIFRKSV